MNRPNFDTYIISNLELFQRLQAYADKVQTDYLAFDVETNGGPEKTTTLWGLGLAFTENKAFYIPFKKPDGSDFWKGSELDLILNWLTKILPTKKIIGHNLVYDVLVFENNTGINIEEYIYADTILMRHCLNEEGPFSLKEIAVEVLGSWADKAQEKLKEEVISKGGRWTVDDKDMYLASTDTLGEYCCFDVILTYLLFLDFSKKLEEENLTDLFYKDEVMPLYKEVTINMKRKGFPVDVEYYKNLKNELEGEITRLEDEIMNDIKAQVTSFESDLLNENFPISNKGNFPKKLAEVLNIPLPLNKDGKITLSKKALEAQQKLTPQFADFYSWVETGSGLDKFLGKSVYSKNNPLKTTQELLFFEKHPDQRYIFNLKSNEHLAELFCNIWGLPALEKTEKTGKPKINDEFLENYKNNEIISKLSDLKKLNKILSTYVDGILDRQLNGVIYTSMLQFGTTSGRFSSRNPNCLSLDTEILTPVGWKNYKDVKIGDEVIGFDGSKLLIEKVKNYYLSDTSKKIMVSIKNQHFDMKLTQNHRVIHFNRKNNFKISETFANKFPKDSSIYHGIYTDTPELGLNIDLLKFIVACQADCEIRKDSSKIRFLFKKKRKYERLLEILFACNFKFEDKSKNNKYEILIEDVKDLVLNVIGYEKNFPKEWVMLGTNERKIFLEELFYWDGLSTRKNNYSSNSESNVDIVQALGCFEGWRCHKRIYYSKKSKYPNYQLDIIKRNYSLTANAKITEESSHEQVWCVEVPSGKILVRRGSDTFITGNCQNLPRIKDSDSGISPLVLKYVNAIRKGFIAGPGYKIVNADYSSLEPLCFAEASSDEKLKDVFRNGEDLYSRVAIETFGLTGVSAKKSDPNYLKNIMPEKRQIAKVFCFTESTFVNINKNFKSIKDAEIGELIYTKHGNYKIINKFKRDSEVLEFITEKGAFKCTSDHKIWSITRNDWIEAKDFVEGEEVEFDYNFFYTKSCSDKHGYLPINSNASFKNGSVEPLSWLKFDENWAWALGAFIGDGVGCYTRISNNRKRMHNSHLISSYIGICGLSEDCVVDKFKKFLQNKGYRLSNTVKNESTKKFETHTVYDFELVKIFQDTLKAFKYDETKSHKNLKVQDFILNSNIDIKLAFIAGLFDTDGYIKSSKNKKSVDCCFCSKELDLISGLSLLLNSLGAKHSICLDWNKTYKRYYYLLNVHQSGIYKLASLGIHKYMTVPRKKQAFVERLKILPRIKNIYETCKVIKILNKNETNIVYDITVEGVHEFYANGIRVHNCLAVPYGAEGARISKALDVSFNEGQDLVDKYLKGFPQLKKYMAKCDYLAKTKGEVKTAFGRVRHLKEAKTIYTLYGDNVLNYKWAKKNGYEDIRKKFKNALNNSKNFPIQGLAAHIVNRAMIAIARKFKEYNIDGYIALTIHDEITCIVNENQADLAKNLVQDCMENTTKISIPLTAEPLIADNWGDSK